MKPLKRLTHGVTFRIGIIVFGAIAYFALSSAFARHREFAGFVATASRVASALPVTDESNNIAIRPFRVPEQSKAR